MRIDGSLKTVTAGITTLDDKRHNGTYAKQVNNSRCDTMRGLVKRPATTWIAALLTNFDPLTDAVFSTIVSDTLFWVVIQPGAGPGGSHLISVWDEDGVERTVNVQSSSSYFNSINGSSDIAFTTLENITVIGNKNEIVGELDIEELWTQNSMLVIKQAPASFSEIEVTWTGNTNIQETVVHTVGDFISDDVGTNTTASAIASLITPELAAGDEVFVQGSTIVIERSDGVYAGLSATDGANDAVAATLNDETQDINNLPKYASHNSVVKIRPDKTSDRGQFWMRATAYVETDESVSYAQKKIDEGLFQDASLVCGENEWELIDFLGRGFQRLADPDNPVLLPPFGSLAPNTHQGTLINYLGLLAVTTDPNGFLWFTFASAPPNPELITYISIVDNITGNMAYESQVFQDSEVTFAGIEPLPVDTLVTGNTYDIYYERLEDFFGKLPEVQWNECADPAIKNHLDPLTMPHGLTLRGDGEFLTGPSINFRPRLAGDDETNPHPEFLNSTLNDIGKFQDRLVILSGETVSMSVTDKSEVWYRETATQQLATDPISIKSTAPNSLSLDYMVTHNNDALLFSKNAQYKLVGSIGMTSQNAALPQTTSYDNTGTVKPVSNASDVFFPIAYSALFSGMSRFSVDRDSDNQDVANAITHHVQELLPGDIQFLAASSTLNMLFVKSLLEPNSVYVYEYKDHRTEPQTAWSKWIFPEGTKIDGIQFRETKVQVLLRDEVDITQLVELRMNPALTLFSPRVIHLDYALSATGVNTTFAPPSNYPVDETLIKLYQGTNAPNPGNEITGFSWNGTQFSFTPDLNGGGIIIGYAFRTSFIPSRRWIRDDSGTPQTASKFRITDYGFWAYGDIFNVAILNAPSAWPTQVFTNDDPDSDAYHRVSFKQRHDEADIEIWTEDPFSSEIIQIEWRGTYIKVGRRF